jgi:N-acetylmuramoyl-L-alanine amidase
MTILEHPSPNHGPRPVGVRPDLIVIHGTKGRTESGDLAWLCDQARRPEGGVYDTSVSYHYLIARDGTVYRLVPEERRAWHAGKSVWEGRPDVNDYSIGIALSNDGSEPYPPEQIRAAAELAAAICGRWNIPLSRIVGHYHVSGAHTHVRPDPKTDPWEHFPWGSFFEALISERGAA